MKAIPVIRLGTRRSPLAMAQAHETRARLCAAHEWDESAVELVPVVAGGDKVQDRPLADVGGKALWTRELDAWLDEGRIDAAVHSLKDCPNVIDIRNLGLIGAIELEPIAGAPTKRAFSAFLEAYEKGLLIRTTGDIIALSPPLIISKAEIDELFGLKMGADDFIPKPFSQRLLVERVRAVLRRTAAREVTVKGEAGTQAQSIVRGNLILDQERHTCTWKDQPVTLTVTEFLILHALAQRPGVVKSRDSLMDAAYDDQVYVDDRTIDSHIKRLRKKFKVVDDSFDMIETLYGVGYRFRES